MSQFNYKEFRRKYDALREMEMSDDDWKIVEEKISNRNSEDEPVYTIPVDSKAIRYLTQAYERLENQVIKLAETMARIVSVEKKVDMTEQRFRNIITTEINSTVKKHLEPIMSGALMDLITSDTTKDVISKICLRTNEQIYSTQNAIIGRINELVAGANQIEERISRIEQRIERLEKEHYGTRNETA